MIMRKERLIIISITEILIAFTLCLHISEQTDKILVLLLVLGFIAVLTDCCIGLYQMQTIREQKEQEERKRIQAELDQKRQKLQALESQINPHFLYNTLDTFRGLALEQGNRELSDMIEALSQMFKYSVKYEAEMVNINAELDYLKHYIQLQQMRFPGDSPMRNIWNVTRPICFWNPVPDLYCSPSWKTRSGTDCGMSAREDTL